MRVLSVGNFETEKKSKFAFLTVKARTPARNEISRRRGKLTGSEPGSAVFARAAPGGGHEAAFVAHVRPRVPPAAAAVRAALHRLARLAQLHGHVPVARLGRDGENRRGAHQGGLRTRLGALLHEPVRIQAPGKLAAVFSFTCSTRLRVTGARDTAGLESGAAGHVGRLIGLSPIDGESFLAPARENVLWEKLLRRSTGKLTDASLFAGLVVPQRQRLRRGSLRIGLHQNIARRVRRSPEVAVLAHRLLHTLRPGLQPRQGEKNY